MITGPEPLIFHFKTHASPAPVHHIVIGRFMEIYKYHQNNGEWVIRRHHANGYEGVGVANGMEEAESICEGMNAAIKLVLWYENGGDDPEGLNEAIGIAKHAVRPLRLPTCHLCGETEVNCDLDGCFACEKWVCPECSYEIESDDGDPVGCICGECRKLSESR